MKKNYLLGYDIGSSSIKAALVDAETKEKVGLVQSPSEEMAIHSPQLGWAEQNPETWWEHVCLVTKKLLKNTGINPEKIKGIGIAYQMHGLVSVDENKKALRPAIIWCDSRAVEIGEKAFDDIGQEKCLSYLLNSPGNFTASKLAWVKNNQPNLFSKIYKIMLPGDFIAMKLTGEILTTPSGLSEGILWDFQENKIADFILNYFGLNQSCIPDIVDTFSHQGKLNDEAAKATGLEKGTPVSYRTGDQPNNAMSLNVLNPGEVAATGGTSGVVYGVVDGPKFDEECRVNGFAHVNHSENKPRIGILLCINGAGIQYRWVKHNVAPSVISYSEMENMASAISPGSEGLHILPFGNGAERMLGNRDIGAHMINLNFNRHYKTHIYRAALEGIAFSFVYGMKILQDMGLKVEIVRVGNDNLFQSNIFSQTISNTMDCQIEMMETTGAIGAAKAAGVALGIYSSPEEAMEGCILLKKYEPSGENRRYHNIYQSWVDELNSILNKF